MTHDEECNANQLSQRIVTVIITVSLRTFYIFYGLKIRCEPKFTKNPIWSRVVEKKQSSNNLHNLISQINISPWGELPKIPIRHISTYYGTVSFLK